VEIFLMNSEVDRYPFRLMADHELVGGQAAGSEW